MSPALKSGHPRQLRGRNQGHSNPSPPSATLQIDRRASSSQMKASKPILCRGRRSNNSTNAMLELQLTSQSNYGVPATDYLYSEDPELTCDLKGDPEIAENWATLALKIRETASFYLDRIDRHTLRQPKFLTIEKYYPDLCSLYRTLFGCAGVNLLSIEVQKIQSTRYLGYLDTFRALIACAVMEWVFNTPLQNRYFEECRQRGVYNEGRISRGEHKEVILASRN